MFRSKHVHRRMQQGKKGRDSETERERERQCDGEVRVEREREEGGTKTLSTAVDW